jgi:hypothetical protein
LEPALAGQAVESRLRALGVGEDLDVRDPRMHVGQGERRPGRHRSVGQDSRSNYCDQQHADRERQPLTHRHEHG